MLIIAGSKDFLSPASSNQELYRAASTPKSIATLVGGWHCGFMDESVELPDPLCRPLEDWMPRDEMLMLTRCLMTPFFDLYLKGKELSGSFARCWSAFLDAYL